MDLQSLCDLGQQQLMRTEYLAAGKTLEEAVKAAWQARDWDTFSRVMMPLQEARRQRRQRCGEGEVRLDLVSEGPEDHVDGHRIIENFSHGQLLVAGWGTIEPAIVVRNLAREHGLYVETFLGAVYPVGAARVVAIVPTDEVALPDLKPRSVDELVKRLPPHSVVLAETELHKGSRRGDAQTYAEVMAMWERLHAPFLAAADMQVDPVQKIEGYLKTIRVDYACELAHQKASSVAKELQKTGRKGTSKR